MSCYCLGMQWCQMPTACACFLDAILKLQTVGSKLLAANHQRSNTRGTCHPWSTYLTCTSARATLWFCRESHEKITFDTPASHIARCRRTHPPISSCVPSTWHEICLIHTPIAHLLYCRTTFYEHVSLQSTPRKSPYNMLTQVILRLVAFLSDLWRLWSCRIYHILNLALGHKRLGNAFHSFHWSFHCHHKFSQ